MAPSGQTGDAAEALRYDMEKLVALTEQSGWTIDRYEVQKLLPDALLSVCRADERTRAGAARQLAAALAGAGGSSRAVWERTGRDLDAAAPLLSLERAAKLLQLARSRAAADCPYYLPAVPDFSGRHTDGHSWFVSAEGGGLFAVRREAGRWVAGGGGGGRLGVGHGLSTHWSLRAGVEIAGAALVDERISTDAVYIDWVTALPVTLRRQAGIYVWDVELAPVSFGIPVRDTQRFGVRAGVLFGVSALRIRAVLPWTGLLVTGEYVMGRGGLPSLWTVRAGVKIGFNLSVAD